jgi:hypothetical protein
MVGDRFLPLFGGRRTGAEHGRVADFLFGPAVCFQQACGPLPDGDENPAGAVVIAIRDRVEQRVAEAADPAMIGHDQLDDVNRLAGARRWNDAGIA